MYPYLFHLIIDVLEDINQTFDLYIPEEEAAYLTLHFQAAIEQLRRSSHNPKKDDHRLPYGHWHVAIAAD